MRLAYLSTDPGITWGGAKGASIHIGEVAEALAAAGAEVLVLASSVDPGSRCPKGLAVEALPGPGKGASVAHRLAAEPARTAWLEDRLRRFGATALYERLALHSGAGHLVAAAAGIPHVVEVNAPLVYEALRFRRLDSAEDAVRLENEVLAGADLVLPVSRPLADHVKARGARRVEILPNAVAIERFAAPTRRQATPPVAIFAGRLRPWHGVDTIAEAWRLLGPAAPGLRVVGDVENRKALDAVGAELTGAVSHDDMPAALLTADIGLAPYAADAPDYFSPLKLFEYLAAGLAVIAGSLPGITDIVDDASAVLIPPGDAQALADAVGDLAADPERRASMGRAGRALVAAHHTWDSRARRIMELVDQLRRDPSVARR